MDDTPSIPGLKRHVSKGNTYARVWLRGRWHVCGRWGSEDASRRYAELIAQHLQAVDEANVATVTIDRLIVEFMDWAAVELADGTAHGGEVTNYRGPLRILARLYGSTDATLFGLPQLHKVRDAMVARGWKRRSINRQVVRVRRIFTWGASRGLVSPDAAARLRLIEPLRQRSTVHGSGAVRGAPLSHVRAVQAVARPAVVSDMIEVLLLTGMRIGELVRMRPVDIDRADSGWCYVLEQHKTDEDVGARAIPLGPKARAVIEPRLGPQVSRPVFTNSRGRAYDSRAFRKCVVRACTRAGVPQWTTHQLRHTAATLARQHAGLDAARAMLGHRSATMTTRYAEVDPVAQRLAAEIG